MFASTRRANCDLTQAVAAALEADRLAHGHLDEEPAAAPLRAHEQPLNSVLATDIGLSSAAAASIRARYPLLSVDSPTIEEEARAQFVALIAELQA